MCSQSLVAVRSHRVPSHQGRDPGTDLRDTEADDTGHAAPVPSDIHVGLITGGFDRPYAYGLSMALISKGVHLDVIGSDHIESPEMHSTPGLNFINLQRGWRTDAGVIRKLARVGLLYVHLLRYVAHARPRILHILWNHRIEMLDRTVLMLLYKVLGKRTVLTAHNVNTARRDGIDTLPNRLSLAVQYHLTDHIFVHTQQMRTELREQFGVPQEKVTIIPFGINNSVPRTGLTAADAKGKLGIRRGERTLLFFGRIQPYKGLEYLIDALELLIRTGDSNYRLVIAGEPKKEYQAYWAAVQNRIRSGPARDHVLERVECIPDSEVEVYFQAADVAALPYTDIYQSGVLFLAFSFGLPAIASDVGSFRDEIVSGRTGFVCRPRDASDLAEKIVEYFASDLYNNLDRNRKLIQAFAEGRHSWETVAELTRGVYEKMGLQ